MFPFLLFVLYDPSHSSPVSNIRFNAGTVEPAFDPQTFEYVWRVPCNCDPNAPDHWLMAIDSIDGGSGSFTTIEKVTDSNVDFRDESFHSSGHSESNGGDEYVMSVGVGKFVVRIVKNFIGYPQRINVPVWQSDLEEINESDREKGSDEEYKFVVEYDCNLPSASSFSIAGCSDFLSVTKTFEFLKDLDGTGVDHHSAIMDNVDVLKINSSDKCKIRPSSILKSQTKIASSILSDYQSQVLSDSVVSDFEEANFSKDRDCVCLWKDRDVGSVPSTLNVNIQIINDHDAKGRKCFDRFLDGVPFSDLDRYVPVVSNHSELLFYKDSREPLLNSAYHPSMNNLRSTNFLAEYIPHSYRILSENISFENVDNFEGQDPSHRRVCSSIVPTVPSHAVPTMWCTEVVTEDWIVGQMNLVREGQAFAGLSAEVSPYGQYTVAQTGPKIDWAWWAMIIGFILALLLLLFLLVRLCAKICARVTRKKRNRLPMDQYDYFKGSSARDYDVDEVCDRIIGRRGVLLNSTRASRWKDHDEFVICEDDLTHYSKVDRDFLLPRWLRNYLNSIELRNLLSAQITRLGDKFYEPSTIAHFIVESIIDRTPFIHLSAATDEAEISRVISSHFGPKANAIVEDDKSGVPFLDSKISENNVEIVIKYVTATIYGQVMLDKSSCWKQFTKVNLEGDASNIFNPFVSSKFGGKDEDSLGLSDHFRKFSKFLKILEEFPDVGCECILEFLPSHFVRAISMESTISLLNNSSIVSGLSEESSRITTISDISHSVNKRRISDTRFIQECLDIYMKNSIPAPKGRSEKSSPNRHLHLLARFCLCRNEVLNQMEQIAKFNIPCETLGLSPTPTEGKGDTRIQFEGPRESPLSPTIQLRCISSDYYLERLSLLSTMSAASIQSSVVTDWILQWLPGEILLNLVHFFREISAESRKFSENRVSFPKLESGEFRGGIAAEVRTNFQNEYKVDSSRFLNDNFDLFYKIFGSHSDILDLAIGESGNPSRHYQMKTVTSDAIKMFTGDYYQDSRGLISFDCHEFEIGDFFTLLVTFIFLKHGEMLSNRVREAEKRDLTDQSLSEKYDFCLDVILASPFLVHCGEFAIDVCGGNFIEGVMSNVDFLLTENSLSKNSSRKNLSSIGDYQEIMCERAQEFFGSSSASVGPAGPLNIKNSPVEKTLNIWKSRDFYLSKLSLSVRKLSKFDEMTIGRLTCLIYYFVRARDVFNKRMTKCSLFLQKYEIGDDDQDENTNLLDVYDTVNNLAEAEAVDPTQEGGELVSMSIYRDVFSAVNCPEIVRKIMTVEVPAYIQLKIESIIRASDSIGHSSSYFGYYAEGESKQARALGVSLSFYDANFVDSIVGHLTSENDFIKFLKDRSEMDAVHSSSRASISSSIAHVPGHFVDAFFKRCAIELSSKQGPVLLSKLQGDLGKFIKKAGRCLGKIDLIHIYGIATCLLWKSVWVETVKKTEIGGILKNANLAQGGWSQEAADSYNRSIDEKMPSEFDVASVYTQLGSVVNTSQILDTMRDGEKVESSVVDRLSAIPIGALCDMYIAKEPTSSNSTLRATEFLRSEKQGNQILSIRSKINTLANIGDSNLFDRIPFLTMFQITNGGVKDHKHLPTLYESMCVLIGGGLAHPLLAREIEGDDEANVNPRASFATGEESDEDDNENVPPLQFDDDDKKKCCGCF